MENFEKMELRAKYAILVKWNSETGCLPSRIQELLETAKKDNAPADVLWKHPQVGWRRLHDLPENHPFLKDVQGINENK